MGASVLSNVHSCELVVANEPVVCVAKLDKAIEEARGLDELYTEYIASLKMMRDYIQSHMLR